MKEPVISDSTCLIGLERIGALNILPQLFDPVIILPEVAREFGNKFSWNRRFNEQRVGRGFAVDGRCG